MEHRRLTNWWIHWEDLHWPNPDSAEKIKRKAERYAQANITSAVIFGCHFRWDYLPYFTLLHDYLATVAQELGQYGIELIDHHSVNLIHRYDTPEEMRHVMLHSGPHIPFSPSREAAKSWEYGGKRLNDWRMLDVKDGTPLYFPQYASEGFCHRNPEFREAYQDYAVKLVKDTGIKGLMADDAMYYCGFHGCACPHCRQELKNRAGIDLPPVDDTTFWGNWDNPAWKHWIDLRLDATAQFHKELRAKLPEEFLLMSCGASSAGFGAPTTATDVRKFLGGCNFVNLEFSGNTPPYKNDPVTVNIPLSDRLCNASHHQAAAREKGAACYGTGYGFTEPAANIIWAANKALGADCHFSTLKPRLGLPGKLLETLPEEEDVVAAAYTFEKEHPRLFNGEHIAQVGVYYSYETRNHTCFGSIKNGYAQDYSNLLNLLFGAGISPHTLFDFPRDPSVYPLILVPSPAAMTDEEQNALNRYTENGGQVVITGPSATPGCVHDWVLPGKPDVGPEKFFNTIRDGVWFQPAQWTTETQIPEPVHKNAWQQPAKGIVYHPFRVSGGQLNDELIRLCREKGNPMPVQVLAAQGYSITVFRSGESLVLHCLALDYDTDIDHHLDEIRYHRSRVNFVNRVTPIGISRTLRFAAKTVPTVYTPFQQEASTVTRDENGCAVTLPENCAYAILEFPGN